MQHIRVLIVEDESLIRWSLRQKFEERAYRVTEAVSGRSAFAALDGGAFDLVVLDYKLPDMTGLDILRRVRDQDGDAVVVMMTAYSTIESAVEAIKLGAFDYISKPFEMDHLLLIVDKALETTRLRREVRDLRRQLQEQVGGDSIIGKHARMGELFDTLSRVAKAGSSTVLLRGETGTGKDLVARVIHQNSERAARPLINITCTAISETLLESELFGHERGAFTDAKLQKKGLFELADGGTVFLDEIGDMPAALQAKLLRFLEERKFRRVGGTTEISVDVRVIAATNRDIEQAIEAGRFRRDLYYRLNVLVIDLPPLRERGDDVKLLAQHYASRFSREFKRTPQPEFEAEAYEKLLTHSWPGNVRELRNVIERAVLLCPNGVIHESDIVLGGAVSTPLTDLTALARFDLPPGGFDLEKLQALEHRLLVQAMERTSNNQTRAARLLNLTRDRLRYRLQKHGML